MRREPLTVTGSSARRISGLVAVVLVGAVVAFVLLNRGAAGPPDADTDASGGSADPVASGTRQSRALVERMLDRLEAGRSARSVDDPVQDADVPDVQVASAVPVGRITIPAMDLSTSYFEGVHDTVINKGPGHWPGTPLPGQPGNAVFSGHRATHGAEFVDLDVLRPGDEVRVNVGDDAYTYRVRGTSIVPESRYVPYVTRQPASGGARLLTLFACNPVFDSTHRIVVRAQLVQGETG